MLYHQWLIVVVVSSALAAHSEYELMRTLLDDYNPLVRPVENISVPVVVYLSVALQSLIDVDEKNQVVTINAWLKYVRARPAQSVPQVLPGMARLSTSVDGQRTR
jgi:nicotinic acetylcholine receptor